MGYPRTVNRTSAKRKRAAAALLGLGLPGVALAHGQPPCLAAGLFWLPQLVAFLLFLSRWGADEKAKAATLGWVTASWWLGAGLATALEWLPMRVPTRRVNPSGS